MAIDDVADLILELGWSQDTDQAAQAAKYGQGSLADARRWFDEELQELRRRLLEQLAEPDWNSRACAEDLASRIEAAGKEAAARRERMRFACESVGAFFRARLRSAQGLQDQVDDRLREAIEVGHAWTTSQCLDALERTLEARSQIDRNAHGATWLDAWMGDLDRIRRGEKVPLTFLAEASS